MQNIAIELNALRRPKLLIRAARAGMAEYRKSCTKVSLAHPSGAKTSIDMLLQTEALLNEERLEQNAAYSVRKHIRILAALMVEAAEVSRLANAA